MDISTHIVSSSNETMAWCADINRNDQFHTYRPMTDLQSQRNAHLHSLLHYRSHTPQY